MKLCLTCKIEKDLDEYTRDKRRKDGRQSSCKSCTSAYHRKWREAKPEYKYIPAPESAIKYNETKKKWREDNSDKQQALVEKWRSENPDKVMEYVQKYRALKTEAYIEDVKTSELIERDGVLCYLCSGSLDFETPKAVHIDHKNPLSRGGEHSYENTALACARCNLSKGAKTEEEFRMVLASR